MEAVANHDLRPRMTVAHLLIDLPFRDVVEILGAIISIEPTIKPELRTMHRAISAAAIAQEGKLIALVFQLVEHFGYSLEKPSLALLG